LQRAALNDLMTALLRKFSAAQACTDRQLAVQTDSYVAAESSPSCLCLYDARFSADGMVRSGSMRSHVVRCCPMCSDVVPRSPMLSDVVRCGN